MSTRLHNFTVDELHALVFRLDIAESVEQLDEVSCLIRTNSAAFLIRSSMAMQKTGEAIAANTIQIAPRPLMKIASLFSLAFTSLKTARLDPRRFDCAFNLLRQWSRLLLSPNWICLNP
jgi:hypothetical protein